MGGEVNVSDKSNELQVNDDTSDPGQKNNQSMISQQTPERRWSERLKKDTAVTTMEKNERMAKKRNLEGNTSNYNSFSALPVEDIITVTADMGVILDATDFDTFDTT